MNKGSSSSYSDIQVKDIYTRGIRFNSEMSGTHMYMGMNGELRVMSLDFESTYRNVRAHIYYGTIFRLSTHTNSIHLHLNPAANGEVRATSRGDTDVYRPIRAASYPEGSSEKIKENIQKYKKSALDILKNSVIYEYNRIGLDCKRELGFIIERETPKEVLLNLEKLALET
ncbi:tail fiber domain-containing protein [Gracilibacillus alcaliphilus]|uniref:tail fiber domain-containing protein n=1 Tax=Gracilibacillus alcaliphilus TaxID=1401441 RepID=UPI00195A9740|nr:tail fiber domain-containing protein [Gracilibacillus alcaliphilus]MBM7679677.1 hypothetical protein [Gracilibacillus alcaliphilus]